MNGVASGIGTGMNRLQNIIQLRNKCELQSCLHFALPVEIAAAAVVHLTPEVATEPYHHSADYPLMKKPGGK